MLDFNIHQSPFSFRYGSQEMRRLWSEANKRRIWRKIWVEMAKAQMQFGLAAKEQVDDLAAHMEDIDIPQALEIESEIHHDLMAEMHVFARQCPKGGGILHLGATSMDIKDNAEALLIKKSLDLILAKLAQLLEKLGEKINAYASLPVIGCTHLQPAEPTTLGYRLANYAQDLMDDYDSLLEVRNTVKGKGFKGAVGTAAANVMLFGQEGQARFEEIISKSLDLPFFYISSQTYSRRQDFTVLSALAALAAGAHKFAFDLRLLQSEMIGELSEPFASAQVGSSAMPFKRNPIESEKIDSLSRLVSSALQTAWANHASSLLERTLDDSANRRVILPQTFLAVDEILLTFTRIIEGLQVNEKAIAVNLEKFGQFSALESILTEAVKNGADRLSMHEALRQISMQAWEETQQGTANPLQKLVLEDEVVKAWISMERLEELFNIETYTGIAEARAMEIAGQIRTRFG